MPPWPNAPWAPVWLAAPSAAWWALGAAAAGGLGFVGWRAHQHGQLRHRAHSLRAFGLCLALLALALRPATLGVRAVPTETTTLLLLDDSCSMLLPASVPTRWPNRHAEARDWLRAASAELPHVLWATLRGEVVAANGPPPLLPATCEDETDLLGALERAARASPRPIGRALIASDGAQTASPATAEPVGPLPRGVPPPRAPLSPKDQLRAAALGWPVFPLVVGKAPADVAVMSVARPEFAFVKTPVPIEATVQANLPEPAQVRVTLWQGDQLLGTESVALAPKRPTKVRFLPRFETRQTALLTVRVEPLPGERIVGNNERTVLVRVLRDKVRVLHVLGRPSADGRFVRQALQASRNVDLVSFYILRLPSNEMVVADSALSLIPFPVHQLFTSELANFDLVLLQDFDFSLFAMGQYADGLAKAVQQGLGLAVVGGAAALSAEVFARPPLNHLLPLWPSEAAAKTPPPLRPGTLLAPAPGHPLLAGLTRLTAAPAVAAPAPSLLTVPRPGATVLLAAAAGGGPSPGPWPLLAVAAPGRGHVAMLATSESWRLDFAPPSTDGAPRPAPVLPRLWQNLLGYLTGEAEDAALTLKVPTLEPALHAGIAAEARWQQPDETPVANAALLFSVAANGRRLPGNDPHRPPSGPPPAPQVVRTDATGRAHVHWPTFLPGGYDITVRPADAAGPPAVHQAVVVAPAPEALGLAPDEAALAALAKASGGHLLVRSAEGELPDVATLPEAPPAGSQIAWPTPLWPQPALFGLLLLAVLAHFGWQSRPGLPSAPTQDHSRLHAERRFDHRWRGPGRR